MKKLLFSYFLLLSFPLFAQNNLSLFFATAFQTVSQSYPILGKIGVDSVRTDSTALQIKVFANRQLSHRAWRENDVESCYKIIQKNVEMKFGKKYEKYKISLLTNQTALEDLVPNIYRKKQPKDSTRFPRNEPFVLPVVRKKNNNNLINKGLQNRNIALWHSHGYYYEQELLRWEWQRARNFGTLEDLLPMSFVLQYLTPMLERAGANTWLPRERDWQKNEVIIDNDREKRSLTEGLTKGIYLEKNGKEKWKTATEKGFSVENMPYKGNFNPFRAGTYRQIRTETEGKAQVRYTPEIPENGEYAVYISYKAAPENTTDAHYTVFYEGGKAEFLVNQQIGGGTWIYLGKFPFKKGKNAEKGSVLLTNKGDGKTYISTDALRFGGGMGVVERFGQVSQKAKYLEAARYYLQFAGFPDTVYNLSKDQDDYKDDYQSRGWWVNYLRGGKYFNAQNPARWQGLGIPVDLSVAFHTDAGTTRDSSTVGTLMIVSTLTHERKFPNGQSRMANRDFGDILQTEIVQDIRNQHDSTWNKRPIWDREYNEAMRPSVPAVLLELLSHHNFEDEKFALDPRFRFTVSRSIYKGILKFLAYQHGTDYAVTPLPVTHLHSQLLDSKTAKIAWKPQLDSLEASAKPERYRIYTRMNDSGFDQGVVVEKPEFILNNLQANQLYSFKITALNAGGESMDSEIVSLCYRNDVFPTALIVNGFDRISAPATVEKKDFWGFADWEDQGVPEGVRLDFIGSQYDFDPKSEWLDDDAPGHGASHADHEGKILKGNNFDNIYVHGKAFYANNRSFASSSDEAVEEGLVNLENYKIVDWIFGEEKEIFFYKKQERLFKTFTPKTQTAMRNYLEKGGNLLVSGAYIGTDLFKGKKKNDPDVLFGTKVLKLKWRTDFAVKSSGTLAEANPKFSLQKADYQVNTQGIADSETYITENPNALEPADSTSAMTILRYAENTKSAAVAYKEKYRVVALGFPFETLLRDRPRSLLLAAILQFFEEKK